MDMKGICDAAGVRVMLVPQAHWNDEEIAVVKLGELRRIAEHSALTAVRRESERIVHSQERLRDALAQLGVAAEGDLPTLVERACGALLGQENALSASARFSEVKQGLLETPVRFPVTCVAGPRQAGLIEEEALHGFVFNELDNAKISAYVGVVRSPREFVEYLRSLQSLDFSDARPVDDEGDSHDAQACASDRVSDAQPPGARP
ncbi:MAG: hypothetical protein ING52_11085 [Burkholderiales bacterium]|jgi:hypothetical protein|nr:hypothetical protein [Burkholderiales bacterium]